MDESDDTISLTIDASSDAQTASCASFASSVSSDSTPVHTPQLLSDPFHEANTVNDSEQSQETPSSSDVVLGQFSFAPATHTTVVTTTTTTTTSFPPLVMKAPKRLHELDPKMFPLAASATPLCIKELRFSIGGRPTVFREADDAIGTLQMLNRQQDDLQKENGVVRTVRSFKNSLETPKNHLSDDNPPYEGAEKRQPEETIKFKKRKASPVSIAEAARVVESSKSRRSRTSSRGPSATLQEPLRQGRSSRLQIMQMSTPITPSLSHRNPNDLLNGHSEESRPYLTPSLPAQTLATPEQESREFQPILSPRAEAASNQSFHSLGRSHVQVNSEDLMVASDSDRLRSLYADSGLSGFRRPRPSVLNTAAAQDASLPSPSLSPVTAAASLQSRRGYFEETNTSVSSDSRQAPECSYAKSSQTWGEALSPRGQETVEYGRIGPETSTPSMMDIPNMLDSFEAMPTEMKTYVMYQLLRRCPKPVLHFVADNVNPALKCDFLSLLPAELCQNIIRQLDFKTLCRAGQVSKRWRQVIDTDEKAWKILFDAEGYNLPPGELQRAIMEGWGWQHGSDRNDHERDISDAVPRSYSEQLISGRVLDSSISNNQSEEPHSPQGPHRRSKRRVNQKAPLTSRKQPRKNLSTSNEDALFDTDAMKRDNAYAEGPYAAAQAALLAVPSSDIGLPSLRSLRLFKSLFRRHHLISSNWMRDEIKPRHLAFKAHQRHVVTCLQFDGDKILTGSDDTNINVYDTRTGALRARLEGHEGGVWALQYEGNVLVSGSTDRSVRVWDIEKGVCTHIFHGHTSTVRCLIILLPAVIGKTPSGKPVVMPKEPIIVTGSRDSTLRVWKLPKSEDAPISLPVTPQDDADSPYFVRALTGHIHSVRAIAAHGDTLVSGSYDCTVRVWKISTGETLFRLAGHAQKVYSVVLDHERNRCISGSMDNLVKVWSLDTGTVLYNLDGHSSLVGLLDLQRNRLVSAAADSTLRIWDPDTGQCKSVLSAHTGAITCFQHDGYKVISGSDRNLKMWDVKTGEFNRDLLKDLSGVWQVKFDGRRCVAAVQRNSLTYIEVLDFGAARDGLPVSQRGRRVVVDVRGEEETPEGGSSPDVEVVLGD